MAKLTMTEMRKTATNITGTLEVDVKRWRNNGVVCIDVLSGFVYYVLHSTAVVTLGRRDKATFTYLDTGGYSTLTTRKAMTEALKDMASPRIAGSVSSGGKKSANMYRHLNGHTSVPFERTLLILSHDNGDITAQPDRLPPVTIAT